MSYKVSVPVINDTVERNGKERIAADLKLLDAERIILALDCYELDLEKRQKALDALKSNCEYFHSQGFEVGAWIWAFMFKEDTPYKRITAVTEEKKEVKSMACPLDDDFLAFSGAYIKEIADTGVDLIMFDDDLRFGFQSGGMGCLCELHRQKICEELGENLSREELASRILSGEKNKYRDAWLKWNGYSLEKFAANARKYVNMSDPKIRLGYCACLSGWDVDGTTPDRLCSIMAGDTKPFVRLIGAPYWAAKGSWGNKLQHVIEQERLESSWIENRDIEIFAEGDTYPRPRLSTPAAYLEGFDTAIRASGCTDGILKYAIDYTSSTKYERGYIEYHRRNKELYKEIDNAFGNKTSCGIRIYEFPKKVSDAALDGYSDRKKAADYLFFSYAARFLSCQAIPTVYEKKGICGIVFGENARHISREQIKGGLIIDGSAAAILHKRGIDVGIKCLGERKNAVTEELVCDGELINAFNTLVYDNTFNENIRVLSYGKQSGGHALMGKTNEAVKIPMSYLYENSLGERFLVINVEAGNVIYEDTMKLLRQQVRGRQIADNMRWLSGGNKLPAYCYGNPDLYIMAKENNGKLTVGIWNFFADIVFDPVIELGEKYQGLRVLNGGKGRLEGDKVFLSDIAAFGFAAFEVIK